MLPKNVENTVELCGRVFAHKLKVSNKEGIDSISGTVDVLTNEAEGTTVQVRVFMRSKYKSGKDNGSYKVLVDIMNSKGYQEVGKEAMRVNVTAKLGMNEYYGNKTGEVKLNSFMEVQTAFSGFWNVDEKGPERAVFRLDGTVMSLEDEIDRGSNEPTGAKIVKLIVPDTFRGTADTFKLKIASDDGIAFFNSRVIEGQTFMKVSGELVDTVVASAGPVAEVAFGTVVQSTSTSRPRREFIITGGQEPFSYYLEEEDFQKFAEARKAHLKALRERFDENSQKTDVPARPTPAKTTQFGSAKPAPTPAKPVAQAPVVEDAEDDFDF